jgi:signal transduction histidine kinase
MIVPPIVPPPPRPKSRLLVLAPFLVVALLFAVTDLLAMHKVRAIRHKNDEIVADALTSIELVSRMGRDIDQVKLLADRHIRTREPTAIAAIEQQIQSAQADYAVAAERYPLLLTQPGEAEVWHELQGKVAGLEAPLAETLTLSRRSQDAAARRALAELDVAFSGIFRDTVALVAINRGGAENMQQEVRALQRSSATILQVLALTGIGLSIAIGMGVVRLVQRREALLARYSELLHASNRELDAFAGRVAHDLRGPLATARMASEGLPRSVAPEQTRSVSALRRSLDRMGAVIEDLLALSRSQSTMQKAVCDPAPVAARLLEDLAPRAESEGVDLVVDVDPAAVQCSEGLLRQSIGNLVDNALKYRRREVPSRVEVIGRRTDHRYELTVRDNGVGMAPDDAAHAFDAFYRAPRTRAENGLGLGLSIVKRAIEACEGQVSVRSDLGEGSTFLLRLRLAEVPEVPVTPPAPERMLPASTR